MTAQWRTTATGAGRPKLAELIAEELRRVIVVSLAPGDRLPSEAELAARFSTSTPTVRQALRVLESEGLVVMRRGANGGPVVRHPEVDGVARMVGVVMQLQGVSRREVFEARRMLEAEATRRLAAAPPPEALVALADTLDSYGERIAAGDAEAASREHVRFHDLVLELCGNRAAGILGQVTRSIIAGLSDTSIELLHGDHLGLPWDEAAAQALDAHRAIYARIAAGDPAGAYARTRQHLDRWIELVPIDQGDAVIEMIEPSRRDLS